MDLASLTVTAEEEAVAAETGTGTETISPKKRVKKTLNL
jgi:hypothetical protein